MQVGGRRCCCRVAKKDILVLGVDAAPWQVVPHTRVSTCPWAGAGRELSCHAMFMSLLGLALQDPTEPVAGCSLAECKAAAELLSHQPETKELRSLLCSDLPGFIEQADVLREGAAVTVVKTDLGGLSSAVSARQAF